MKQSLAILFLVVPLWSTAQNPIIRDQFTADPTARVFNDRVYLYPSHDIHAPEGQRQDWFCMEDYHVFSSDNLIDWQDHGTIISQADVPWGKPDGYSMWAPDCVMKNGKYYFYFPDGPKTGRGFSIGVATADRPEGPFTCETTPINGVSGIDPCVLLDDDGQAYLYWSGMGIRGAKLKANMKEIDGELQTVTMAPPANNQALKEGKRMQPRQLLIGGKQMEGLPEGFKEGPFAFKQDGHYYLTFPWVRKEKGTETLAYAMSDHPLGPWQFKGIIMAEHENGCWTNHHSIVCYRGQWYLFYHNNAYSPRMDKRRSVCIDRIRFNADGTIQEVKPTLRGVGIAPATNRLEVDRYSASSGDVTIDYLDTLHTFRGWQASLPKKGSWLSFNDVDFSRLTSSAYLVAQVKANDNTTLFVRENHAKGKVIARLDIKVTSEGQFRRDQRGQWLHITAPLNDVPKGVSNLCITCEGTGVSIDWLQFKNHETYYRPAGNEAARPDSEGFIRRWRVLEPIKKDIRSNTLFTDTYLRKELVPTAFVAAIPNDKQTVKVGKQRLSWHSVDSERFNLKLFRFAESLQKPVYGVLFWTMTVIDCPEELTDVRLAVGSNSASRWWLNGEEALLLSGDRRMVKDDAVSHRLTLKKGRNVLLGAIINGPGMSDFCVRFLNENNLPITNLEIR